MLNGKSRKIAEKVAKAIGITLLAFGLSLVIMQPFTISLATLVSAKDRQDFNITDFYNIIADGREVRELDRDIVIVDITGATREDVAFILDVMPDFEPRAVGLDVIFDVPHGEEDSLLINALVRMPDLAMIVDVEGERERGAEKFSVSEKSFFVSDLTPGHFGASNLPTKFDGGVVREFAVDYPLVDGGVMPSFPVAVASMVDTSAVSRLRSRGKHLEIINYPSRTFRHVKWENFGDDPDLLRGKIALIGAMENQSDMHATPPQRKLSGIEIHALALSTILNDNYIDSLGSFTNLAIAFVLCFLMAIIHLSLPPEFKSLALRLLQVAVLYAIIRIGYSFFIEHSLIIDFSYTLLMMAFVLFACDIWYGVPGFCRYARRLISKLFTRRCASASAK